MITKIKRNNGLVFFFTACLQLAFGGHNLKEAQKVGQGRNH